MLTGKELKLRRITLDIKAVEIAEHLNIHKSYISKMENGHQAIAQDKYKKWIEFLGL